jgi:hypothetical protein
MRDGMLSIAWGNVGRNAIPPNARSRIDAEAFDEPESARAIMPSNVVTATTIGRGGTIWSEDAHLVDDARWVDAHLADL